MADIIRITEQHLGGDLLLANGFSCMFCDRFNYPTLFKEFYTQSARKQLFDGIQENNFETLLSVFSYIKNVNKLANVTDGGTYQEIIDEVRTGLIKTVGDVHPKYSELDNNLLEKVSFKIGNHFNRIFTTNYDILTYYVLMKTLDLHREGKITKGGKDSFTDHLLRNSHSFLEFHEWSEDLRLVNFYYIHGGLFLFENSNSCIKLKRSEELIEDVKSLILQNEIPLFVSEGSSFEKHSKISRNRYLTVCLDRLRDSNSEKIFIFGSALAEQDNHIWDSINRNGNYKMIYFSIYDKENSSDLMHRVKETFKSKSVTFFDSDSLFQ